jgi:putative phosphoribosyl transferase
MERFLDRHDAGRQLAEVLKRRSFCRPIVMGLPRGGVPVAYEVAKELGASLDVFVVRKLGVPYQPELAMGAIASGGILVRNDDVLRMLGNAEQVLAAVERAERVELERRERLYRGNRPPAMLRGRDVLVVDDGLATGATMKAAVLALEQAGAARVVVAVPVGPPETCAELEVLAHEVVCLRRPARFMAVGQWYDEFGQTSDDEVRELLDLSGAGESGAGLDPGSE